MRVKQMGKVGKSRCLWHPVAQDREPLGLQSEISAAANPPAKAKVARLSKLSCRHNRVIHKAGGMAPGFYTMIIAAGSGCEFSPR